MIFFPERWDSFQGVSSQDRGCNDQVCQSEVRTVWIQLPLGSYNIYFSEVPIVTSS